MRVTRLCAAGIGPIILAMAVSVSSQQPKIGYDDTPMQPNGKWHIHDGTRPQPKMVAPGATPGAAPADATVLLGPGSDVSAWKMAADGAAVTWPMQNGVLQSAKGMIETKAQFTDFQLHVEFAAPTVVKGTGQGRGNSGIFLMNNYEIQVLDSYDNKTYFHGQAGSIYKQHKPLANPMRKPGEWNVYDIVFTAPVFDEDGKVLKRATFTAFLNGVLVQNAVEVMGVTAHDKPPYYEKHDPKMPISLQDHGDLVRFRNIWVRNLD